MPSVGPLRSQPSSKAAPGLAWRILSIIAAAVSVILSLVVFGAKLPRLEVSLLLLLVLLLATCTVIFVHGRFLLHLHHQHRQTAGALHTTEHEFQQMADNIQEIFWMLDARTKKTIYVNQAYETITGRSCQSLQEDPSSYEEAIHPEDRPQVLGKLQEASQSGEFDERFRIVRPNGEVRWVSVRGFPVRDSEGSISRLVGTVQEITGQKQAEDQVIKNLTLAENAWAESEALRKATLALTQDLRMDFVLDALLQSLTDLISCDCARIWFLEGDTRLFVAREKVRLETSKKRSTYPLTLDAADIPLVQRILESRRLFSSRTQNTSQTGKHSLAIPICAHGFAFRWWPPNTPSVFYQSATTSLIALHERISATHNFWQSPLQSLFKILVFMNAPRSMDRNLKNASMISTQQKKPWRNQRQVARFGRINSGTFSVPVQSHSPSQPSAKGVSSTSMPLSRHATVILGRT